MRTRLGAKPAHCYYGPVGGESPIRYLHEAAQRIARGECSVAAVCGAEAQSTATKAERAGVTLPWTPFAHDVEEPKRGAVFQKPMAVKLGVFRPITVYPLYEAATSAHWGQTPREALAESGELWSTFSERRRAKPEFMAEEGFAPDEITTPTPDNRLIAWPYTKLMVANPIVNMGGALLMTSAWPRRARPAFRRIGWSMPGRRVGGRAARLSGPRPVFRKPSAECGAQGGDGSGRRRRQEVRRHRTLQLLSLRAEDGAAHARSWHRRAADGHRRADLLRRAAQHLHDACGLRDGAQACATAASSACSTARAASSPSTTRWCCRVRRRSRRSSRTPACRRRPTQPPQGAGVRHRSQRQGQGRELYGDLSRQWRRRTWRRHAAHGGRPPHAWRAFRPMTRRRWRICSTWIARRSARSAIS